MTLEEAKKILKKEVFGIRFKKFDKPLKFEEKLWIRNEKPEVLEALHIVAKNGISVSVPETALRIRSIIIKKMKAGEGAPDPVSGTPLSAVEGMKLQRKDNKNTDKNPALAESASQFKDALLDEQAKKIKDQNHELTRLISLVEKKENSISRLYYEKSVLEKENEELKKGEIPTRYFDKALVDVQEKKIKKLEHEKLDILEIAGSCKRISAEQAKDLKRLGKEISKLNGIIHDKNEELKRKTKGCCQLVTENVDLEKKLSDKDAVLSDVAEELRLSKIREKNLTEVCQKYVKEVEDLREKLADKVVDKIDAQALKSAESALAYKEKVIAEKDEVIADLTHELKNKHKRYVWYKGAYLAAQQILNTIADYAAKHPDKKFSDQMAQDAHVECGTKVLVDKSVFEQIMKKAYGK